MDFDVSSLVPVFQGLISAESDLPDTYAAGWYWKVAVGGSYKGHVCSTGDYIIAVTASIVPCVSGSRFRLIKEGSLDSRILYSGRPSNKRAVSGSEVIARTRSGSALATTSTADVCKQLFKHNDRLRETLWLATALLAGQCRQYKQTGFCPNGGRSACPLDPPASCETASDSQWTDFLWRESKVNTTETEENVPQCDEADGRSQLDKMSVLF